MGWEAYGVEMDDQASDRARSKGISVLTGDLFEAKYPGSFLPRGPDEFCPGAPSQPEGDPSGDPEDPCAKRPDLYLRPECKEPALLAVRPVMVQSRCSPTPLFLHSKDDSELLSLLDLELKALWFDSGQRSFLASLQYSINDRYHRGSGIYRQPRSIAEVVF